MSDNAHRRRRDSYDSDAETNNNESDGMSKSELSRQIDKLQRDLQRRDRELEDERQENLRVLERIKKLERDKVELRREAEDFRDEANEYKKTLEEFRHKRKPDEEEAKQNLELTIQHKNHEIRQLLDDIEKLEGEKNSLQSKLHELKESLQEATTQLESMTHEHMALKSRLQKSEAKVKELQDDKVILEIKVKDLLSFKQRHDQYLENLCSAVDVRVDVWKKMMFQKDEEIDRLNVKIATLANQIPTGQAADAEKAIINQFKMKLLERESTISTLNEKLAQATQDLESATEHINSLNSKLKMTENPEKTGSALESLQFKVAKYKSQLEKKDIQISQLEKESDERASELTSLLSRMHAYETSIYGLSEAIAEIKELKTQLRIRNGQIETQTQELNTVSLKVNDLSDENEMLRDKLGVGAKTDLKDETQQFLSNRHNETAQLKTQISALEDELVTLKSRNYTYRKQLNQVDEFGKNKLAAKFEGNEWKDKYEVVLGENAELRKGLQEILETMQRINDDGTADVLIECPILENLLREMSARGLIHYPYGISSFHLKVCNLEGKNSQLREEIHRLKQEEKLNRTELINANATIQALKDKLASVATSNEMSPNSSDSMVLSLQAEVESLHAQIKHLQDVLQFESSVDNEEKSTQTVNISSHRVTQTENIDEQKLETLSKQVDSLNQEISCLKMRIDEQNILLDAKDKVIQDFNFVNISYQDENKTYPNIGKIGELEEALNIARETANSLQERLKAKEENINQYRTLLAEVRNEMTSSTNRHVQEMRALQLTIYQQQQAFTRMKSTLSQPVKDSLNIEGTIKDQLTRIHELEDEVSELQHGISNVASQLTAARSEAHRWRCTAEARLKEMDQARETQTNESIEEISLLRDKLKQQMQQISELQSEVIRLKSTKESINDMTRDIVKIIRNETHATTDGQKSSLKELQERLSVKENEISVLTNTNKTLQAKVSQLQTRISKITAVNKHSGVSAEMEQLKNKYLIVEEEKTKLENDLRNLNKIRDEEEEKRKKQVDSMARWEEAKRWKKQVEKLEAQIDSLKKENEKLTQTNKNLRANITRLDKMVVDCKKLQIPQKSSIKTPDDAVEVDKLKFEIQDLNELVERTEFEGKEKIATLEMEIRCLKERILTQERQLTAYQVAQKGDPKIVSELEKMAGEEEKLQKIIGSLEEENLHLKLQIDQLRLDTPRLRDRVQQLQRLVEVLKQDKPESNANRASSQKSLSELERTISALKQLIEKLQTENKRLRVRPSSRTANGSSSSENLKTTLETLMAEKKALMDQLAMLEEEKKKYQKMYIEANSSLESVQIRLLDAERRAKSSEMKLRTFLGDDSDEQSVYQRIKSLECALERKTRLLDEAKNALKAACN